MRFQKTRIFVERSNYASAINIHIAIDQRNGKVAVAKPLQFEEIDEVEAGGRCIDPAISLDPMQAQTLADELWQAGFRPTQGQQSEGQMGATGKHLNDMRALVSALAKVELPK